VIIAIVGALVGLAVGATGMGSGILSLPLLLVACCLPPIQAVGTALLYAAIVKVSVTGWYAWRTGELRGAGPIAGRRSSRRHCRLVGSSRRRTGGPRILAAAFALGATVLYTGLSTWN
jgi:hypothetical protein